MTMTDAPDTPVEREPPSAEARHKPSVAETAAATWARESIELGQDGSQLKLLAAHFEIFAAQARAAAIEEAAKVAETFFKAAHTYASENAYVYRAQDDAQRRIAASIRTLIERWINNKLHYWNAGALGHERRDGFTDLADYAVRFAREEDATTVLFRVCDGQGRVAQHAWIDGVKQ